MGEPLRIAFAGTPEFAVAALDALAASPHPIVGVWTQPDRPAGRGQRLSLSPVKRRALGLGLPVLQPATLKDPEAQAALSATEPDLMVVVAYGLLLPVKLLTIPRFGCLNIHASLLPKWRGAAPIQRAILAGDAETGISIMQMDKGLDTGAVLSQSATPIGAEESAQNLHDRLAGMGAVALLQVLQRFPDVPAQPQDESVASYATKLTKEEAQLDWRRPALELARAVRAYNPWPVAYTLYRNAPLRIWSAIAVPGTGVPGTVLAAGRAGIDVATGEAALRIQTLQAAGGRALAAADFANGRELEGLRLG